MVALSAPRRHTRRSNPAIRAAIADGKQVRWISEATGAVSCLLTKRGSTDMSFVLPGCGCEGEERLGDPLVRRAGKENGGIVSLVL